MKEKKKGSFTFDKGKQSIDDVHISGKYKQGSDPEATGSVGAGPKGKDNIIIPGATYRLMGYEKGKLFIAKEFGVESNQTVDLGEIVVEKDG